MSKQHLPSARQHALDEVLAPISDQEIDDALRTLLQSCGVLENDIAESARRGPDPERPTTPTEESSP